MTEPQTGTTYYFETEGVHNTEATLDIALACCRSRGLGTIVVASASGATALRLREKAGPAMEIIDVTYGAGHRNVEAVERFNANRDALTRANITIVRGLHALSGVERTFERKYKTGFIPLNVVQDTLRMFSKGMKVCVEVAVMAAEAGLISPAEEVVVLGGSGSGVDTAVLLKPGYAPSMFDLRIREILCMSRS